MKKTLFLFLLSLQPFAFANDEGHTELYPKLSPAAEMAQRPPIPKLLSPKPLAEIGMSSIELKWTSVETATAYAVQLSSDPNFFNLLINEPLYKGTSYVIKDIKLDSNKNYYWRVDALKEDNQPGTMKSLFNRSSFSIK